MRATLIPMQMSMTDRDNAENRLIELIVVV